MADQRLNVFPSRMVLTSLKDRNAAARTGYDLLKKKSDAIKARLQKMLREILDTKRRCVQEIKNATFAHTDAQWAAENFNNIVIENVKEASYRVKGSINNVAGVKLPVFERATESHGFLSSSNKDLQMLGLSKGGNAIAQCRDIFTKTLDDLVVLASLQTSLKTLDDALKITNRKVNALEFVIVPQIGNTIKYVISELDELEREDQYRIKKVKDLRTREDEEEAEAKKKEQAENPTEVSGVFTPSSASSLSSSSSSKAPSLIQTQQDLAIDALDNEEKEQDQPFDEY